MEGPGEIHAGAFYEFVAASDGSPSAASNAATSGYGYTMGPPPFARTTPAAHGNQCAYARGFSPSHHVSCDPIFPL